MGGWRGLGTDQIKWDGQLQADSLIGNGEGITELTEKFNKDYIYHNRADTSATLIFTWDDGEASAYSKAYPIMEANNQKGVAYIIPYWTSVNLFGNRMTLPQLQELYNVGWDIGSHSWNHQHLNAVSTEVIKSEIDLADNWLKDNGFQSRKFFAYPYGDYSQEVIDYLKQRNFLMARSIIEGRNDHLDLSDDNDRYLTKIRNVVSGALVATVKGYVDNLITSGGLLVLLFHVLTDTTPVADYEYLTSNFQSISDYVAGHVTSGSLTVKTFSEYYAGYSRFRT